MSEQRPTYPVANGEDLGDFALAVDTSYRDATTGQTFVHRDLVEVQKPWAEEAHIAPPRGTVKLGDSDSFVDYVARFASAAPFQPLLTWNQQGLRAVLDYHAALEEPGRCQWIAELPFRLSRQWERWTALANGQPWNQRQAVERLEDLAEDIKEPDAATLTNLLRVLRGSANAMASTELRPDGTASLSFEANTSVKAGAKGTVDLPPTFKIYIPVLKGQVNEEDKPLIYGVVVRLRVNVDENARLGFRFSIPDADRYLDDAYDEQVRQAQGLLGDDLQLLRAAD